MRKLQPVRGTSQSKETNLRPTRIEPHCRVYTFSERREQYGTSKVMTRRTALAFLLALSLLYCLAELVPGRIPVTDEVFFKAAGRNWANTGRFAAPELKGYFNSPLVPRADDIFFAYPPIYPFLFGVYTKIVGFGPRSCILYDVLIHLLLIWCGALVARFVFGASRGASVFCGALLLPLGTVGRPDELGIVFALCAALALRTEVPLKIGIPIGGALLGLTCATSLGACLFLGTLVGCEVTLRERSYLAKFRNLAIAALIAIVVLAVCVAPILVPHPLAYRQLATSTASQSVLGNANSGGYHSSGRSFLQLWQEAVWFGYDRALPIVGGLTFLFLCWLLNNNSAAIVYSRFVLVILSLLLLLVLMPGKYTYLWFQGSWLLIACVALGERVSQSLPAGRRRFLLTAGSLICMIVSLPYFRWKAILWTLPPDQTLTFNTKIVRDELPKGASVLTTEYWWALADRNPTYDTEFSNPGLDSLDYIAVTGNGTGRPGAPMLPSIANGASQWQNIDNHLRTSQPSVLGFRLSKSAYGFGPYILKKSNQGEAATPAANPIGKS